MKQELYESQAKSRQGWGEVQPDWAYVYGSTGSGPTYTVTSSAHPAVSYSAANLMALTQK